MSGAGTPRTAERATLDKAADENFPVAPFFLPRAWRTDLMAVYGFARLVDDIGEDRIALLDAFEADLRRVFEGTPRHPLLQRLVPVVRRRALTPEPFLALIAANRQDQTIGRYETYEELRAYCALSADPVGRLVLAVTGTATPERIRLSDRICTALQIVEHLQDVTEDLARDRIYLPAEDLRRFRVEEADIKAPSANASVRALIAFEAARAHRLLDEGSPLVASVHGRLRLLLAGFVAGGRSALGAVAAASFDVLPGPPKPTKVRLLREVGATLRGEG